MFALFLCEILDYDTFLRVKRCLRLCYEQFHIGTFFLLPNNLQYLGSSRVPCCSMTFKSKRTSLRPISPKQSERKALQVRGKYEFGDFGVNCPFNLSHCCGGKPCAFEEESRNNAVDACHGAADSPKH